MNIRKKLNNIGFEKTIHHKIGKRDPFYSSVKLIPDLYKDDGSRKEHPKNESFWILKYNDNISIWCLTKDDTIMNIWVDDSKDLTILYRSGNPRPIKSEIDIINLFPLEIKRDFILRVLMS